MRVCVQSPLTTLTKLQPSSKEFNPWLYLGTAHAASSRQQLKAGMQALDGALAKRRGQLRQLVKDNFQRFIGCKGTIDDISMKLKVRARAALRPPMHCCMCH